MIINWSPQVREDTITVVKSGNTLTVNGEVFDFSFMNDGDVLPFTAVNSMWVVDNDITMTDGELELTLLFPIQYGASYEQRFPTPSHVVMDGPVPLPGDPV